ncbi:hypothetical protein E2C01_049861 [Portunus trituberculatus]|uniref:Uncharacterized protein n=1 Tax=Portunus trituberculatus TaxID=210409 RepID=A0A5B7GE86_PORTR|nr:hypothetical protein [Portunus trituberculatus]
MDGWNDAVCVLVLPTKTLPHTHALTHALPPSASHGPSFRLLQLSLTDAMKAKARLSITGGKDLDNGRVSAQVYSLTTILPPLHPADPPPPVEPHTSA